VCLISKTGLNVDSSGKKSFEQSYWGSITTFNASSKQLKMVPKQQAQPAAEDDFDLGLLEYAQPASGTTGMFLLDLWVA
jgi:hypothetical protein